MVRRGPNHKNKSNKIGGTNKYGFAAILSKPAISD
jgi:hypothetical protein